jgi:hypothetical protein
MTSDLIQSQIKLGPEHMKKLFSEDYFYNVGDNPALKRFLQIEMENHQDGNMLEYRTYFIDKNKRFLYHRNVQDVLQRDLKAYTFPRALAIFGLTSAATYTGKNSLIKYYHGVRDSYLLESLVLEVLSKCLSIITLVLLVLQESLHF